MNSLYGKISGVFLVLLVVLAIVQGVVWMTASRDFIAETDQKLNQGLARDLALRFEPYLRDSLDVAGIEHEFHELMVMNPRVEIYLLGEEGMLMAYFAPPEKIKRMSVDLEPVRRFLLGSEELPVLGDDPRSLTERKPIAVEPVHIGPARTADAREGYLYVILGGEQYESTSSMVRDSYILRTSGIFLGGIFVVVGLSGLFLFSVLTRRLRVLTGTVRAFAEGRFDRRVPVSSDDEIGQLARTFNRMADTLADNVETLKKNDDLRRELVANVSHDLRSPLASIHGYIETVLMKEDTLSAEDRRRYLETIFSNVSLLGRLVDELFELSRLDARQVEPETEPFSLAELAQDTVLKFRPQAEERRINLHVESPDNTPLVEADIGMIERVLSNLIDNALRYTPEDGEVAVRLTPRPDGVEVAVTDDGDGIPAEELPYIFDRFYRVEKSRSRTTGGTGLGLAIAKKILEAHHRTIEVRSTLSRGTTFSFSLAPAP